MNSKGIFWLSFGAFVAYVLFSKKEFSVNIPNASNLIDRMADAIQRFEGWIVGSVSYINNNPGNIKYFGGEKWLGQVGVDQRGFVIFDTYEHGRRALIKLLTNAATGALMPRYTPQMSIYDFFSRYAPSSDNNEPKTYAEFVAGQVGVSPNEPISVLV